MLTNNKWNTIVQDRTNMKNASKHTLFKGNEKTKVLIKMTEFNIKTNSYSGSTLLARNFKETIMTPYKFDRSHELFADAKRVIPSGTMRTRQPSCVNYPTYIARAKGCRMWDVDGNEFIDLLCSIGPVLLGYAYDRVDDEVIKVIRDSFQSSTNHPKQIELAELLVDMVPSAERVRFFKTGTDATVAAARLARCITKRMPVARHGYHGWADLWKGTDGCPNGVGGVDPLTGKRAMVFDGTPDGLERLFTESQRKFAAVIVCPADTRPFTTENFQGIVDVAHQHGALVIFDEVKTGFRVANGGAQELLGVLPDITTISKGMGNGYPISAVVGKAEYMERFDETPSTGTFSTEALSITASLETLKIVKNEPVVDHLWQMGQRLIDGLQAICLEYNMEEAKAYADPVPSMPRFTWHPNEGNCHSNPVHKYFFEQCIRYGLFFCSWHVAFVNYSHTNEDIDKALEICDFAMSKTRKLKS